VHLDESVKNGADASDVIRQFVSAFPRNIFDLPLHQDDTLLTEFYMELVRRTVDKIRWPSSGLIDTRRAFDLVVSTSQDTAAAQSTFQPLFGYMRGNFATELARNLVTLVTFRQRQRYAPVKQYSCDHH